MDIQEKQTVWLKEKPLFEAEFRKTDFYKMNLVNCFCFIADRYVWDEVQAAWGIWQAAKAQAVPEGFVLISKDQAKDTERLNFLLSDERYVRTVVQRDIQNEDYEKIGEHFLFTEMYWIDGWDYHENTSSQSKRGALDKAMIEAQEQKG